MPDPRVRLFLNVKHNRKPYPPDTVALDGLWAIQHAVAAGIPIDTLFVCTERLRGESGTMADRLRRDGVPLLQVGERTMLRMSERDGPDGLAALARLPARSLDDIDVSATTRIVVADSFELAGNLGTIIRCADGAGASAVLVTEPRLRVTHPLVVKASMATVLTMPVVDVERAAAVTWMRSNGMRIVAADPAAPTPYRHADYGGPLAIVVGSERAGLAPFWRGAADVTVSIPMLGVADSLNVGHAAALLLYEAVDQSPPPGREPP